MNAKIKQAEEDLIANASGLLKNLKKVDEVTKKATKATKENKQLKADLDELEKLVGEEAKIRKQLQRTTKKTGNHDYEVKLQDGKVKLEGVHKCMPDLVKLADLRINAMLVGPTGSFKTTSCEQLAEILSLGYDYTPLGPTMTESGLFGYRNANGDYVSTGFRETYEHGGVHLLDEFDAGNPNVLVKLNAALEQDVGSFPDGIIKKHKDAVFVCAANTWGRGADNLYVGRNQLDAATLERFATLAWDYDEELEMTISTKKDWCAYVQLIRKQVEKLKIRHPVSPRASIKGSKLLEAGFSQPKVEDMLLWKGLNQKEINRIKQSIVEATPAKNATRKTTSRAATAFIAGVTEETTAEDLIGMPEFQLYMNELKGNE